jgi:hypothetical protein
MPSLLDIAPPEIATERVTVRGVELEVRGLSALDIARVMKRFPDIRLQSVGKDVPAEDMLLTSLEATPAIIAAGLGQGGNQEIENQVAIRLSPDEQAALLDAIMTLTNPAGKSGPLASAPANGATGAPSTAAAVTK